MPEVMEQLEAPDFANDEQLENLLADVTAEYESSERRHGIRSLKVHLTQVLTHKRYLAKHQASVLRSINTVNGVRVSGGGSRKASPETIARKFFASLAGDENMLKLQCKAFGLRYDMYDSEEDIIHALVQARLGEGE